MSASSPNASELVGREAELSAALGLLEDGVRLLTLTGPPGVGKTRLALAVADASSRRTLFPDGVVFVDLSSAFDAVGAMTELARSLGVGGASGDRAGPLVEQWLASRRMLLILDNAEQVVGLAPELVGILDASPQTQLLVTSRENMHLTREHEYSVPPMQMPSDLDANDVERARRVPSVAMFRAFAQAVDPGFEVTEANARAVAEICVRLDGLPLALALAAARVKLFTPDEIAARLRDRKAVLQATDHDVPARHRTLHAAISWSHAVLSADERRLFRRLAVFAGAWTVEAAEAVCASDDLDLLELLASLIDKSLVQRVSADSPEAHFAMLQSVRDFASEQLAESGDADRTAGRHMTYFAERVVLAELRIGTTTESLWWETVSTYEGDIRLARQRALAHGDVDASLGVTTGLAWAWYLSGHIGAAQAAVDEVLPVIADPSRADPERVRAFRIIAGVAAWATGDFDRAAEQLDEARASSTAAGDERRLAMTLAFLGNLARDRGQFEEAKTSHRHGGELYDRLGHDRGSAWARFDLGRVDWESGDTDEAVAAFRDALERFRRADYPWAVGWTSWALGTLLAQTGVEDDGGRLLTSAMAEFELVPDYRGLAMCWESLAILAEERGLHAECVRLAAAAAGLRARLRVPQTDAEAERVDRAVEAARTAIGDYQLDRERQRGLTLSTPDARALAEEVAVGDDPAGDATVRLEWDALTAREQQVAELVAEGRTNQQIGSRLGIAARTAEAHVHNIMTKLDAGSRAEIAVWVVTDARRQA